MSHDLTDIVVTNDDAAVGKNSAVQMGYYRDPYVTILVKPSLSTSASPSQSFGPFEGLPGEHQGGAKSTGWQVNETPGASRSASHIMPPLINRGYYARVSAIRAALQHFLSNLGGTQIVSLGAGFDTTYFMLKEEGLSVEKYIEIDVAETVAKKASAIRSKRAMFGKHLPNLTFKSTGEISSDFYQLVACDLRDVNALDKVLTSCGLDKGRPTLFLSECVLIYMTVEESAALIKWSSEKFDVSYFVLYEQVEPHDNFGKAMLSNLKARGCPLLSILEYPTLGDQQRRFEGLGWDSVEVWDMNRIIGDVVVKNPQEKKRVDSLEFMDELEEETLMHKHYCIALASHHVAAAQLSEENCRTAWRLKFADLYVPLGPPHAATATSSSPSFSPFGAGRSRFPNAD